MNEYKIGGLVVTQDARIVGMFTERDVLRKVVAEQRPPASTPVRDVMTADVLCCAPETDLDEVSRLMKDRRIRHVPVCGPDGRLLGMVTIGDLNAYHASDREATIHFLNEFLYAQA
jgi:CBS domain-containing protein